jgi:hypothetical protein
MTGMWGRGYILTLPFTSIIGFVHARVFTPSIFIAHDPQIPSRQDRLKVSVESVSFFIFITASNTIGPQFLRST